MELWEYPIEISHKIGKIVEAYPPSIFLPLLEP
jgi:hypothetical protein